MPNMDNDDYDYFLIQQSASDGNPNNSLEEVSEDEKSTERKLIMKQVSTKREEIKKLKKKLKATK